MGDYGVLCRYQQRRQSDREATIGVTDSLVHLFANRWTPLVVGRNIGLMTMELFTPARCAGAAHSWLGGALKAVLRNKQCKVLM